MDGLKNIAGNDVSIFLFRFELKPNGIDFVINETIAEDMYPDLDAKIKPLAHASCETLLRYSHLSVSKTIMDCNVLDTGELEVMLSKGLGKYFIEVEKDNLFQDAQKISEVLHEVMNRKTKELNSGRSEKYPKMEPINIDKSLAGLGHDKALKNELLGLLEGAQLRPGLKQMRPEDLPKGVTAERGYDHRGHCIVFKHKTHGKLGKIVLIGVPGGQTMIQADLNVGQGNVADTAENVEKKKKVFEKVVAVVHKTFKENFGG